MENCTVGVFTMASMAVYGFSPHLWPKSEFADVNTVLVSYASMKNVLGRCISASALMTDFE